MEKADQARNVDKVVKKMSTKATKTNSKIAAPKPKKEEQQKPNAKSKLYPKSSEYVQDSDDDDDSSPDRRDKRSFTRL